MVWSIGGEHAARQCTLYWQLNDTWQWPHGPALTTLVVGRPALCCATLLRSRSAVCRGRRVLDERACNQ